MSEQDILAVKHSLSNRLALASQMRGDVWCFDGLSKSNAYDKTFTDILSHLGVTSIDSLIERYDAKIGKPNILDVMGGCYFGKDAHSLTGIRLRDVDPQLSSYHATYGSFQDRNNFFQFLKATHGKRKVIEGDVFNSVTWTKVMERAREVDPVRGKYSMIFFRPVGPVFNYHLHPDHVTNASTQEQYRGAYAKVYFDLLSKGLRLMDAEGIAFLQWPEILTPYIDEFSQRLQRSSRWDAIQGIWNVSSSSSDNSSSSLSKQIPVLGIMGKEVSSKLKVV